VATGGDEVTVEVVGVFEQGQLPPEGVESQHLLVLRDAAGRELQIPIGSCEGLAVYVALQQHVAARPLTHDLAIRLLEKFSVALERIVIDDLNDDVYRARLHLVAAEGEISLPARPGDAIALALRAEVPICVTEEVFARARESGADSY